MDIKMIIVKDGTERVTELVPKDEADRKLQIAIITLTKIANETDDLLPPFAALPRRVMVGFADEALKEIGKLNEMS